MKGIYKGNTIESELYFMGLAHWVTIYVNGNEVKKGLLVDII
jgi:hypothetical protein